jgi:hypothetical protein
MVRQPQEDSSQRRQQDLSRLLLRDWLLRQALQVVLPRLVLLAAAVAAPAANWQRVLAVPAQPAAALHRLDLSAPGPLDSYLLLPAVLVQQAELVQAKPTRTRVNRDR